MKISIKSILLFLVAGLLVTSCEFDNYDAPSVTFKGALLYNNVDTIYVQQSANNDINGASVYFNMYEPGAGYSKWKSTPIRVVVGSDGTFSSMLFADNYKLVMPKGNGPYMASTDTTEVKLTGNQTLNIPVTPYYLVRNFTPTLNASDSIVTASFKIDQIINDANAKTIGSVILYINRTIIVDGGNNLSNVSIAGGSITDPANMVLKAKLPNLAKIGGIGISTNQKQFFVRVGVRINGSSEIFSPVKVVTLP